MKAPAARVEAPRVRRPRLRRRPREERAGDRELLLHAARERPGRAVSEGRQRRAGEQVFGSPLQLGARDPVQARREGQVLEHRELALEAEDLGHVARVRLELAHVAAQVEDGRVTWAGEAARGLVPGHAAAEVRALPAEREEAAVRQPHEVELPRREGRHRAGSEPVRRPGDHEVAAAPWCLRARLQERGDDPRGLPESREADPEPREPEKGPARLGGHGHTSLMPAPRNQIPASVRTAKAVARKAKRACVASRRASPTRSKRCTADIRPT